MIKAFEEIGIPTDRGVNRIVSGFLDGNVGLTHLSIHERDKPVPEKCIVTDYSTRFSNSYFLPESTFCTNVRNGPYGQKLPDQVGLIVSAVVKWQVTNGNALHVGRRELRAMGALSTGHANAPPSVIRSNVHSILIVYDRKNQGA